jgi:hypothetical protein
MSASANSAIAQSPGNEHDKLIVFSSIRTIFFLWQTSIPMHRFRSNMFWNIRMNKVNSGSVVEWLDSTSLYLTILQTWQAPGYITCVEYWLILPYTQICKKTVYTANGSNFQEFHLTVELNITSFVALRTKAIHLLLFILCKSRGWILFTGHVKNLW